MFFSDMTESRSGRVQVEDIPASVFQDLLYFIYTGIVQDNLDSRHQDALLAAADKYQVESLVQIIMKWNSS